MARSIKQSILLILTTVILGCSSESLMPSLENAGLSYFPIQVGQFYIYEMTDININLVRRDTLRYQLREYVLDSFRNQSGGISYRVQRDVDRNDGAGWQNLSMVQITVTSSQVIVNEDNLSTIKLVFPLKDGVSWDGNSFNSSFRQLFTAEFLRSPLSVKSAVYDNAVKITLADIPENLTGIDQKYDYYAPGIGLVHSDYTTLRYCTRNCSAQFVIEGGRVLKQNLVSYGKM